MQPIKTASLTVVGLWMAAVLIVANCGRIKCETDNISRLVDELDKYWTKMANFRSEVNQINKYLEENVKDGDNYELSMKALGEMADKNVENPLLHQTIMAIIALEGALDECDKKSYIVLAQNYLLIGGNKLATNGTTAEPDEIDRVKRLVHHYAREHKNRCLPKYAQSYERIVSQVNQTGDIEKLERWFPNEFIDRLAGGGHESGFILEVKLTNLRVYDPLVLMDLLSRLLPGAAGATSSAAAGESSRKKQIGKGLNDLRETCANYDEWLKPVLVPAKFDALTFAGKPSDLCAEYGKPDLCHHWRLFRTCEAFLKAKKVKLLHKLVAIDANK